MIVGDSTSVGGRIKAARQSAGLSQTELAEGLGVKQQSVARWESDGSLPSAHRLGTIARLLQVPVEALLEPAHHVPLERHVKVSDKTRLRALERRMDNLEAAIRELLERGR